MNRAATCGCDHRKVATPTLAVISRWWEKSALADEHKRTKRSRRSIRLREFDYSQPGLYFVTMVTQGRENVFGEVTNGAIQLNQFGEIVRAVLEDLPTHYQYAAMDISVIMPNHLHGIIVLHGDAAITVGAGFKPAPTSDVHRHGLSEIVRALKTFSARRINESRRSPGRPLWQRNYYEHVIRSEESLARIRQYILDNPLRWEFDPENPVATKAERSDAWRVS
jgi:putative transposase